MTRTARCQRLTELGLVPVVRAPNRDGALALARALFEGGIHCLELTFTVPGVAEVIALLRQELGAGALVGAGTVTTVHEADVAAAAGAEFLVSPGCLPDLVPIGHQVDIPVLLGALTPTEVLAADRAGADFVKIFPANALGGAPYLKALRAPFPGLRFVPTGGVSLTNMATFLEAGAAALGVGAALADYELLRNEGAGAVTALARRYRDAFAEARAAVSRPSTS